MVRGRDAADGAMVTSFGSYALESLRVWTDEIPGPVTDTGALGQLQTLPEAPALTLAMAGTA